MFPRKSVNDVDEGDCGEPLRKKPRLSFFDSYYNRTIFRVQAIILPKGGVRSMRILNLSEDRKTKKCIIRIWNDSPEDRMCGLKAIITGLTFHTNEILGRKLTSNEIKYIKQGAKLQKSLAKELQELLGEEYDDEIGCTLENVVQCESLLETRIKVVSSQQFNAVIYSGNERYERTIYLYLHDSDFHYDVIHSMGAPLGCGYFCNKCNTGYKDKSRHPRCHRDKDGKKMSICLICMQENHRDEKIERALCPDCNRYVKNEKCKYFHKTDKICEMYFSCKECGKLVSRLLEHVHECGVGKCRNKNCGFIGKLSEHLCHLTRIPAKGGKCWDDMCTCKQKGECQIEEKECMYEGVFGIN